MTKAVENASVLVDNLKHSDLTTTSSDASFQPPPSQIFLEPDSQQQSRNLKEKNGAPELVLIDVKILESN
jgi:hypothetical protein